MTIRKFTIPTADIKAHVERICEKHGLTLATETLADSPSPYVVVRHSDGGLVVGVAYPEGEGDEEAIAEIWKVFVRWGIV